MFNIVDNSTPGGGQVDVFTCIHTQILWNTISFRRLHLTRREFQTLAYIYMNKTGKIHQNQLGNEEEIFEFTKNI